MVRLPSTLDLLVGAGESSAEQYELLRWVRCLSPHGLTDRAGVLTLLDDAARESEQAEEHPPGMVTVGSPTPSQVQVEKLRAAGYLDEAGCAQFDTWPGEWDTVSRIVAEARAALERTRDVGLGPGGSTGDDAAGASVQPADTVDCQTCGRRVPVGARYCGYCGIRVQSAHKAAD